MDSLTADVCQEERSAQVVVSQEDLQSSCYHRQEKPSWRFASFHLHTDFCSALQKTKLTTQVKAATGVSLPANVHMLTQIARQTDQRQKNARRSHSEQRPYLGFLCPVAVAILCSSLFSIHPYFRDESDEHPLPIKTLACNHCSSSLTVNLAAKHCLIQSTINQTTAILCQWVVSVSESFRTKLDMIPFFLFQCSTDAWKHWTVQPTCFFCQSSAHCCTERLWHMFALYAYLLVCASRHY